MHTDACTHVLTNTHMYINTLQTYTQAAKRYFRAWNSRANCPLFPSPCTHAHTHDIQTNISTQTYTQILYLNAYYLNLFFLLVPPLKGFVMNRVTGDYFETLLYKIFVSIDEHTSMSEVLQYILIQLCTSTVITWSTVACQCFTN